MSKESLTNSTKRFFRDTNRWSIILLAIGLLIGAPIFFIGFQLFAGAGEMWQHLVDYLLWDYLSNSFSLALGCSFLTIFIGVSCAWIVSRYYSYHLPFLPTSPHMLIPAFLTTVVP